MLLLSVTLLAGFLVLFKSADYFVIGAVATANNLRIAPMIVGLTVVALGTSAPEIFVAAASSLRGEAELAVGNAIGSNIANIGLVLGITAMLVPLKFRPETLRNDLPVLIFVTLCAGAALVDHRLGIWDGLLLFVGLGLFLARVALEHNEQRDSIDLVTEFVDMEEITTMSTARAFALLGGSLVFLLLSAELLVWAVIQIAGRMGVSEMVIGLTVIAVGTSLPELVVSVTSALKHQTDLAIGNIVGSNIFNLLAVLGIPAVMAPSEFDTTLLFRDYPVMLAMTLLLVVFAYGVAGRSRITRLEGGVLILVWCSYLVTLYYSATPPVGQ